MPGVTITTAVRTGAINTGVAPASTFFIACTTSRGTDTQAVEVRSLEDFESSFGPHVTSSYGWYSVKTFFEEGGLRAYVASVNASAAVRASKALVVGVSTAGITLTAVGKGTWGNDLSVAVLNNTTTFDVTVTYSGTSVFAGTDYTTLADAVTAINNDATAQKYFTAALTTAATDPTLLATLASTVFTGGTLGSVAKSDFIAALDLFLDEFGAGAVAIPGIATGSSDAALYDALRTHAAANNRIALCGFASSATNSTARSASTGYTGTEYHEYMAFFHPWVTIPNSGVDVTIPPEGYVAGVRARVQVAVGPWKPFAGVTTEAVFVNGTALAVSRTEGDLCDASYVNPIRVINGRARVYGARSHSTVVAQWRFITARDTINYIVVQASKRLEDLVFSTIDGRSTLYANIINACQSVLEPVRIAGGFYEGFHEDGRRIDYGYTIKCDSSLNSAAQLESGLVKARIGVRVSSVGDKIIVELIKSNLTTALA